MQLTQRNIDILKIIVEEYLSTGEVLGSKLLLKKLEQLELVYQPYNSAGRLPTSKWLRAFVNYLMNATPEHFLQEKNISDTHDFIKLADYIHSITLELSKNTKEIAFFMFPERHILEYSGVAQFLEKNYKTIWNNIYNIISMLEDKFNFMNFIETFPLQEGINIFIWEENFTPFLQDYTIILKKVVIDGNNWYIGILWWLKMNYSFNISAVRGVI